MRNVKTVVTIAGPVFLVLAVGVAPLAAQDDGGRRGLFLGGGVNVTQSSTEIGGDTGSKFGVGFTGIMTGVKGNGLRSFSVDLQLEPFEVQNPRRDERYSSFSVVVSGYLGPVGLGLGWQQRTWSGTNVWVDSDGGIALQATAALPILPVGSWAVSPDAFVRLSGGDEISTTSLGVRVLFGRLVG